MTPVRLAKLLDGFHPVRAWRAVQAGAHPADPDRRFVTAAASTDVEEVWANYGRCRAAVLLPSEPGYPSMLLGDPGAPAVLFARGDPTVVEGAARVAIVGTRSATPYGRQVASELASDLAAAGVIVVSGLARGYRRGRPRRSFARVWGRVGSSRSCRRHGSRYRLSGHQPRTVGSGRLAWSRFVGGRTRDEASSGCVPGSQSDHCCFVRRGRGGGEPPRWRVSLHGRGCGPPIDTCLCSSWFGQESSIAGDERVAGRWMRSGTGRRRCPGGDFAGSGGQVRKSTGAARHADKHR